MTHLGSANKSLLADLKPVASLPIVFIVLASIINNAWFPSLFFAFDRFYEVTAYCLLSIVFVLNAKLFFTLRFVLFSGSLFFYYLLIGILNNSFSITSTVVVVVFWINCFVVYCSIKKVHYDDLVKLTKVLIASQFICLVLVDFGSWLISHHGLPTLYQTILPLPILGILFLGFLHEGKKKLGRFSWAILLCFLYIVVSITIDSFFNEEAKLQKIQLGLVVFSTLYFVFLYLFRSKLDRGRLFYLFSPISLLLLVATYVAVNLVDITATLTSFQPSSGYLRFAVNFAMINDMSDVSLIFGKGLGSSFKHFGVADLHPDAFMFEFDEMFPHSGLLVLLYEYGVVGLMVAGLWVVRYLSIRNKTVKTAYNSSIGSNSSAKWMLLGLLLFFLFQNGMYVQGVPSGDLYFQSNAILYVVLIRLILAWQCNGR